MPGASCLGADADLQATRPGGSQVADGIAAPDQPAAGIGISIDRICFLMSDWPMGSWRLAQTLSGRPGGSDGSRP